MSPLEPIHAIHRVVHEARSIATSLCNLGIPAGEDLRLMLGDIDALAKQASQALCQETNDQYRETREQSNRMLEAIVTASLGIGAQKKECP